MVKCGQNALPSFGQITRVSLLRQLIPKRDILERQAKGLLYSLAALASKSLAGNDIKYGKRYVRFVVNEWLIDPNFEYEVAKRRHKYDNAEY